MTILLLLHFFQNNTYSKYIDRMVIKRVIYFFKKKLISGKKTALKNK